MKIVFYAPDGSREKLLVASVLTGALRHGDEIGFVPIEQYAGVVSGADACACYGVRASTRIICEAYRAAGKRFVYFDKPYWGRGDYVRFAVDAWQPTAYFLQGHDATRLRRSGLELRYPVTLGRATLYAATAQTWADFYCLGSLRALEEALVKVLVATQEHVLYRPRPGYRVRHPELCEALGGAELAPDVPLAELLLKCSFLVTLGSNAAIEAAIYSVPVLVLGDNPAALLNANAPRVTREQFFSDLAWCQWTADEWLSGEAWAEVRRVMEIVR